MTKSLADIAAAMRHIDFCVLTTRAQDGSIAGRPMSNNSEVAYEGTSWFYTYQDHRVAQDVARDSAVGVSYQGSAGLLGVVGKPGLFIHVEGTAKLVHDKACFAEHWDKSLDRWFPQGIDTPGLVLIEVAARRIHYWDGMDESEVKLPATAPA
ncbi:MAG: pyridoxamine 5'-phosphate oxidase family protein [Croceibacterium sp.]